MTLKNHTDVFSFTCFDTVIMIDIQSHVLILKWERH